MTSNTSSVATKPFIPVSGSKTLLVCKKPSTVKIIPSFLTNTTKGTLRILPQSVSEEPVDPRITSSAASAQSSSVGHPANQGSHLSSQSCLTPNNQDPQKLGNPVHTSSTPTKESCNEDSQCSKMSPKNVIFTDHSYTSEIKKTLDASKDSSDPAIDSTYHMLLKEVLDLGLAEEAEGCGTGGAVLGTESGDESKAGSHLVEEDDSDCTELTEDSDMYHDTDPSQSSDDEDQHVRI